MKVGAVGLHPSSELGAAPSKPRRGPRGPALRSPRLILFVRRAGIVRKEHLKVLRATQGSWPRYALPDPIGLFLTSGRQIIHQHGRAEHHNQQAP